MMTSVARGKEDDDDKEEDEDKVHRRGEKKGGEKEAEASISPAFFLSLAIDG